MSGLVTQTGTVYSWGKGTHEPHCFDDYKEYSTPFCILEEKLITHLSFGVNHVMAIERAGSVQNVLGWGDGKRGCLGLGDGKKRAAPIPIEFFEGNEKRVIDVSCGDNFTVVIAEVIGDPH